MEEAQIFGKTQKGNDEVRTRQNHLVHNLRYLLIMVDGKSTVAELREKCKTLTDVPNALDELQQQGYISCGELEASADDPVCLTKRELIAVAREVLGDKASAIEKKIREAEGGIDGLMELSLKCEKLIKLTIDEKRAKQFIERCRAVIQSRLVN